MSGSGAGARRTSGCAGSWAARRLRAGRAGRARQAGVSGGARQAGTRGAAGALGTAGLGVAWAQPVSASRAKGHDTATVRAWVCSAGPDLGFGHSDSVFCPV